MYLSKQLKVREILVKFKFEDPDEDDYWWITFYFPSIKRNVMINDIGIIFNMLPDANKKSSGSCTWLEWRELANLHPPTT